MSKNLEKRAEFLSNVEERNLFISLNREGVQPVEKMSIAERISLAYAPLVIRCAYSMTPKAMHIPDLIQEGFIGILKAMKKYDVNLGFRFGSLAAIYAKCEMLSFLRNKIDVVRITDYQRRKGAQKIGAMIQFKDHHLVSSYDVNRTISNIERQRQLDAIENELKKLDDISFNIMMERWLCTERKPLKFFAKKFGISVEAVRKREAKAIARIQNSLNVDC